MSKKVKIYCYKLAKPVVKTLMKNLEDKVGRVEYEMGYIKENLGNIYLITLNKLKKGDEIALSNNFKFSYGGSLNKKINYVPYSSDGINATDGSFIVMPGKGFLKVVDPNNSYIETVILYDITNKIFQEEKKEIKIEGTEEELSEEPKILSEEPIISQVTLEEQEPIVSTDPLDKSNTLFLDPEDVQEAFEKSSKEDDEIINIEIEETPAHFSENPEEWFEESIPFADCQGSIIDALEEMEAKVEELEKENYRLSKKINDTVEEVKKISFLDIILFKWKTKLLNILNL